MATTKTISPLMPFYYAISLPEQRCTCPLILVYYLIRRRKLAYPLLILEEDTPAV